MKIAVENKGLMPLVAACGLFLIPLFAHAADTSVPPALTNPPTITPSASASNLGEPTPPGPASLADKDPTHQEVKVPDSVKDVVKHLNSSTENITLDDLNAAREAVAKLDALIDIEKRLADLEKLRQDREGKPAISAIPSSALNITSHVPMPSAPPMAMSALPMSEMMPVETVSVDRVVGTAGHYMAYVKEPDGTRLVRAGDHLTDGSTVMTVMSEGIEVEKGKTTHLIMIKNVQTVFGNNP